MVLRDQKSTIHNAMLGQKQTTLTDIFKKTPAKAPSSQQVSPHAAHLEQSSSRHASKRRKLSHDGETQTSQVVEHSPVKHGRQSSLDSKDLVIQRSRSPRPSRTQEVPDSDAESGDEAIDPDEPSTTQRTDIEQALPPIKTDKEAIEEYEALRAAEGAADLEGRLGSRKWVQGKSSIYVDAFNLALETVLAEESHLFDEAEMRVFADWRDLSYEAQYLYVRLFLRKTAAWHRIGRLGYYGDIADMEAAVTDLFSVRSLPQRSEDVQISPGELAPPSDTILGESFTFADCSNDHITTLEEASSLLLLDELKNIAKDAKVQGKNKSELLRALRRTSGKQTGLGFANLKRSDTEESVHSIDSDGREDSPSYRNRDEYYTRKIMNETGQCIRLSAAALKLFERVHLVFYRSTEWTEKSLTTIILARIARRNFPEYIVSRSANIFASRSLLLEFEASLRTQFRVDSVLEFNGTPTKDSFDVILDIFEQVYPRWQILLKEEQSKEDSIYSSGEGAYLRRLSPAWVYTRIVHKGAYVLGVGKVKQHAREHAVLSELLAQRLFHASRRGSWYQRKALLEEHYMAALSPLDKRTPDQHKKHWKQIALATCEDGLQDNLVHLIYHHDLQKRVVKLERQLKIAKRLQHDFGHARLAKPKERTFHAVRIERPPPSRPKTAPVTVSQRRLSTGPTNDTTNQLTRRGAKTLWLDPAVSSSTPDAPDAIVSVEAMCLSRYRALGWRGYHTEGGILRTLFALLFADVLFLYLPNVFQTPYQTCPLDLHTDAFYPSRMSEINARIADIENGGAQRLVRGVWAREAERRTCIVGLDWGFELEDLCSICRAFAGARLGAVMRVMCQEYAQRGGGVPDLFLWREGRLGSDDGAGDGEDDIVSGDGPEKSEKEEQRLDGDEHVDSGGGGGEVLFAEVKSENDRLSDTQRLWIHVLTGAGIRVELCNALASEVRVLDGC